MKMQKRRIGSEFLQDLPPLRGAPGPRGELRLHDIPGLRREIVSEIAGIVRRAEMKEAPADAANTGEGGAEQNLTTVSASSITENRRSVKWTASKSW